MSTYTKARGRTMGEGKSVNDVVLGNPENLPNPPLFTPDFIYSTFPATLVGGLLPVLPRPGQRTIIREGSRRRLFGRDSIIHLLLNPCSIPEQRLPFVRETTAAVKAKREAQHIGRMSDWGQDKARENHSVRPQMSCT